MLTIRSRHGREELALVYVAETSTGSLVEFAEALQPPLIRDDKWVLIVSTLRGCPVACPICDAGGHYQGKLASGEILDQIDYMVTLRYPDRFVKSRKLKIQFARMGDPAFNDAVIDVLRRLPLVYDAPGLMPCISTVAPAGRDDFFEKLLEVKQGLYPGRFQMQFSLHTTDEEARKCLVPTQTWSFAQMAAWGQRFHLEGERKIALNFAPARGKGIPLDAQALAETFSPEHFAVKLTPINPTAAAIRNALRGVIDPCDPGAAQQVADRFRSAGFDTILSIGEPEENLIGSNCGMYVQRTRGCSEVFPRSGP